MYCNTNYEKTHLIKSINKCVFNQNRKYLQVDRHGFNKQINFLEVLLFSLNSSYIYKAY